MNKKGFTLVELLAVLVVLSIILVIAYPYISDIIEKERKETFRISVNFLIKSTKNECSAAQSSLSSNEKTYTYKNNKFMYNDEVLDISNTSEFVSTSTISYNKNCEISLSVQNDGYKATKSYSDSDITIVKK
jgi:type IV pilus assembly protein PilA